MFCPHCGSQNDNNSTFCGSCGKPLDPSPAAAPQTATQVLPKRVAPAVTKPTAPLITKEAMVKGTLAVILTLLYAGLAALFIMMLNFEDTIAVESAFDSGAGGHLTLKTFLDVLVGGNRIFNPTPLSAAIGIGAYILIYSVPAFALMALIGTFIDKKGSRLYVVSTIITAMASAAIIAVIPVATKLLPDFKQALSVNAGLIFDDVDNLSFTSFIIVAAIAVVLIIITGIITSMFNKRRAQK